MATRHSGQLPIRPAPQRYALVSTGLLGAIAVVVLAASVGRQQAFADDRGAGTALPADLSLVPVDASGFITFRVADLWANPVIKSLREKLSKEDPDLAEGFEKEFPKRFQQGTGVAMANVERLTFLPEQLPMLPLPELGLTMNYERMPMIIATREPINMHQAIATLGMSKVEREYGGVKYFEGRARDVRLQFVSDRTLIITYPPGPLLAARPQGVNRLLEGPLRMAAGKHAVVHGLVPGAWVAQYEGFYDRGNPFMSFAFASHPLVLARYAALMLDVGATSRLELRLVYRKEATAAVGEEALRATLQQIRRQLGQEPFKKRAGSGVLYPRLGQGILNALDDLIVDQQDKVARASVNLTEDMIAGLIEPLGRMGVTTRRLESMNHLKQLAIAMHNFHSSYGHFPRPVVHGKDGKALYSWRVALLPFVEENKLYNDFKCDEPWDSPSNKQLLARMPKVFAAPGATRDEPFTTHYQVLIGGGAMFEPNRLVKIADISDGLSNTIMIVEAIGTVPWSKPVDLTYAPQAPLPRFGGVVKGGFNVALADGSVMFMPSDTPPAKLRALITKAGGEAIDWPDDSPEPPQKESRYSSTKTPARAKDRTQERPALSALPPEEGPSGGVKRDMQGLQGVWQLVMFEDGGKQVHVAKTGKESAKLVIAGNRLTMKTRDGNAVGTFSIDPTKKPKVMDSTMNFDGDRGKTLGVYELDGNTLKLCCSLDGKTRPPALATTKPDRSKPPSSQPVFTLFVYERAKP